MPLRKVLLYPMITLLLFILFLMVSGSPVLLAPSGLHEGLPAGNVLAWLGMVLFPATLYLGLFAGKNAQDPRLGIFRLALLIAISFGLIWGVVAYGLAGNWSFNFSGQAKGFVGSPEAGTFFWYWNYLALGLPLFILLLYAGFRMLK